jgi:hypothetical protein
MARTVVPAPVEFRVTSFGPLFLIVASMLELPENCSSENYND